MRFLWSQYWVCFQANLEEKDAVVSWIRCETAGLLVYLAVAIVLTELFTSNISSGNYLLPKFLLQFALDRGFLNTLYQVVMKNLCNGMCLPSASKGAAIAQKCREIHVDFQKWTQPFSKISFLTGILSSCINPTWPTAGRKLLGSEIFAWKLGRKQIRHNLWSVFGKNTVWAWLEWKKIRVIE